MASLSTLKEGGKYCIGVVQGRTRNPVLLTLMTVILMRLVMLVMIMMMNDKPKKS